MKLSESQKKHLKKAVLFFIGWFTIPSITGGWLYDLFGTSDFLQIWDKIIHPSIWLDAFTVYTIAFLTFGFLPPKISKRNLFIRFFYFVVYYLILLNLARAIIA